MEWYLPLIWAALIGTAVFMYVLLDGFDLGIGILFPTARTESERDQMTRTIAPYWDGNETWLILGWRWSVRGISKGVLDHHAGVLLAGDRDASRVGFSRRCI